MKYLITGSKGLLGSSFSRIIGKNAIDLPRDLLNQEDHLLLQRSIEGSQVDVVVNCAAHVNADQAEDDPAPAYHANVEIPRRLASVCQAIGIPLVHLSSTGCYGAWKSEPYSELDPVRPTTVHHQSKIAGEEQIKNNTNEYLIIRTGWLFGGDQFHQKNFVWRRILEALQTDVLKSDVSQRGCPTWADDVVHQTCTMLQNKVRGTFNCVNAGAASRFEYVAKIIELFHLPCSIVPTGPFTRRAPVSPNETAINYNLQQIQLDHMPTWTNSLESYRNEILTWPEWQKLSQSKGI
jgi:dTDP-4-dehydrorhamnose reductase